MPETLQVSKRVLPYDRLRPPAELPPSPAPPSTSGKVEAMRQPTWKNNVLEGMPSTIATTSPTVLSGSLNREIVEIISTMPHGGGHSVKIEAKGNLIKSISMSKDGKREMTVSLVKPSFCSSAT